MRGNRVRTGGWLQVVDPNDGLISRAAIVEWTILRTDPTPFDLRTHARYLRYTYGLDDGDPYPGYVSRNSDFDPARGWKVSEGVTLVS